jgi:3-methylcrotonyl-CoA carboxylase alpha subunit
MFGKILIANRGEIAVRVARTAARLGIASVAVYSSADREALHVEACDEAFAIGAAAASESYLNASRILAVAQQSGATAIHPGYGFLSENAAFAHACEDAGITFIGPPPGAIEAMGSKSEAKAIMEAAGVPLIPGYHGSEQSDDRLALESKRIGYPQLLKASAGGGGKGMRLVEAEKDFNEALASARREASSSFGDDRMLIERYLRKPRHVEMQVFADSHGNCVHLFERDCSIQRRHQKVLEEAPAPGLDEGLRQQMAAAAIDCAQAIGYVGAGTVEFLVDEDGSFYFMEMNTRLQVEHPVTEMITGQDLVEWQLRVAAGGKLPLRQEQIVIHGHALEARIYAESPERDFMPAAGRIGYLQLPVLDASVRVDTGVRCGDEIGINYDPMIAKLIVHGPDRTTALARLAHALQQYQILGLNTNLGFLSRVVASDEFVAADFDTGFIARHHARLFARDEAGFKRALVQAAAALFGGLDNRQGSAVNLSPWDLRNQWRMNLKASTCIQLEQDGSSFSVNIERTDRGWKFNYEGGEYQVRGGWIDSQHMRLEIDDDRVEFPVLREPGSVALMYRGQAFKFGLIDPIHDAEANSATADNARAPMSGVVVALPLGVGDTVEPGTTLVVIEAMKMEHAILAQLQGSVGEILVAIGDQVDEGDTLVVLEHE